MSSDTQLAPASGPQDVRVSNKMIWTGAVLSAIPVLFLLFDSTIKIMRVPAVVQSFLQLGYPEGVVRGIGIVLLTCVVLYVIPRTSVLGAILLTGYLGGATATHVRVGDPWVSHVFFPSYVALLLWSGLVLRDGRVRALIFPRRARFSTSNTEAVSGK